MRVAIYARVSTRDKGQDPENQVHQLRAFAEQHRTLHKVFTEEVSGGKSDRSEFKQLRQVRAGHPHLIGPGGLGLVQQLAYVASS